MDVKQFKQRKKLALVGFAPTTRHLAPFDDDSYDIWTVNEAGNITSPAFSWVKRFDVLFQIHPRWDFSRKNNTNDPNHFWWLKNISATCNVCNGTGENCDYCTNGTYHPPVSREWVKAIFMQEEHPDIPQSVRYPIEEMVALNPVGKYFDSSLAFMTMLGSTMGYEEIFIVGFEMAAQSEYFYQRSNFEYLIGVLSERGQVFRFPPNTTLLKGPMYAYENMKTGYRQMLDMRIAILNNELQKHTMELAKVEGELKTWKNIQTGSPLTPTGETAFQEVQARYGKLLGLTNIVKGAIYETENLRKLYDSYFVSDILGEQRDIREVTDAHIKTVYGAQ